jgi:amino acid adenylation domain-containing protein
MLGHCQTLLKSAADNPERPIGELPILTPAELEQALVEWNRTEADYPNDRMLHELIEEQVERTPDAVALVFENQQLTYRQLNDRADRLAHHLQKLGVGPNVLVAIYVERSLEMMVGLLGILKAGGTYVPLDPIFPPARLAFMLEDCHPRVILTLKRMRTRPPANKAQTVWLDGEQELETSNDNHRQQARQRGHTSDLAYVLYTSGSTGNPKGVQISNRALVNFLSSMLREPGLRPVDTMLAVTTISFDIAGLELFLPLMTGARVVIASREAASDGQQLSALMKKHGITVMQATPATWRLLLEAGWIGSPELKILCGGEAWTSTLAHELLSRCKSLWNMYGPTETTIWSSVARVRLCQPVLIGSPIANTAFFVLDASKQLVPVGVPGELYIGGDGLADGYFNRPDLTNDRFVNDPFHAQSDARLYKTGDVVRRLEDGEIEFLGRNDQQIKVRGFRIELGEIETALRQYEGISQSVVIAQEDGSDIKRLVAYVMPIHKAFTPRTSELRSFLKHKLPSYMIPSTFVIMEELPLTPNGKIDRKRLLTDHPTERPSVGKTVIAQTGAAGSPTEVILRRIWERTLAVKDFSTQDSFFDLGGHSLLAVELFAEIKKAFNIELPMATLYEAPTIKDLARILSEGLSTQGWSPLVPIQATGSRPVFFCFHAAGGNVLNYRALSKYMGPEQPFYGLQSQGLDGVSPLLTTIEDMAALYVRAIRTIQPSGPYFLGGYCLGGTIAYEVAQQLHAAGEQISLLALFDTLNWSLVSLGPWKWTRRMLERIMFHWTGLIHLDSIGKLKFLKGKLQSLKHRTPVWAGMLFGRFTGRRSNLGRVWQNNHRASRVYIPRPYPGSVTEFRPSKQYRVLDQPDLKWDRLAKQGQRTVTLPVYPGAMLVEPFVKHLAAQLLSCIDDASRSAKDALLETQTSEEVSVG